VRDLSTGAAQLVSRSEDNSTAANGVCRQATISADGRWVAFTSIASNLVPNDTNQLEDVFFRDLAAQKTYLASHNRANRPGNAESASASISPNGDYVAFESRASDLVAGDINTVRDVFLYERATGALRPISMNSLRTTDSYHPVFSPDGKWIVFESATVIGGIVSVKAWNLVSGELRTLASDDSTRRLFPRSFAFSGDGHKVAFEVQRPFTNGSPFVALHQFEPNVTLNVASRATAPSLNKSGDLLAYLSVGSSFGPDQKIQVIDFPRVETNIVSVSEGDSQAANAESFSPSITPDGRFVVFASRASNLVAGDKNGKADIFARDLHARRTIVLSRSLAQAVPGNDLSSNPVLGRDGRTVLFTSFASDVAEGDFNQQSDLFAVRLPGPESDFRVTRVMRVSTGEVTLIWNARPGILYRLEFTESLPGGWQPLNLLITINGEQASAIDATAKNRANRFYRIVEATQ